MSKRLERLCHAIAWSRASTLSRQRETPEEMFDCGEEDEIKEEAAELLRGLRKAGLKLATVPLKPKKPQQIDTSKPVFCTRCEVGHPNLATAQRLCSGEVCLERTPADAMCDGLTCTGRCCRRKVVIVLAGETGSGVKNHAWCAQHRPRP